MIKQAYLYGLVLVLLALFLFTGCTPIFDGLFDGLYSYDYSDDYSDEYSGTEIDIDIYEPDNNMTQTVNTITVNGTQQRHTFNIYGDQDYIIVQMTEGVTYTIATCFLSNSCDTTLTLFNAAGSQLAFNDDYSGFYSRIVHTCTATGSYYIRVTEFSGTIGDYKIDITADI